MALQGTSMKMLLILTSILANLVTVHSNCYTYNGESFMFVSYKRSYEQAKRHCEQYPGPMGLWDPSHPYLGGSENNFVYHKANQLFADSEYWISTDWANTYYGWSWGRSELERAKPTAKQCWDYSQWNYSQKKNMQGRAMRVCGMSTWRDSCKCFTQAKNYYQTPVDCTSIPGSKKWFEPRAYVCHLFMGCDFHTGWGWGRNETEN